MKKRMAITILLMLIVGGSVFADIAAGAGLGLGGGKFAQYGSNFDFILVNGQLGWKTNPDAWAVNFSLLADLGFGFSSITFDEDSGIGVGALRSGETMFFNYFIGGLAEVKFFDNHLDIGIGGGLGPDLNGYFRLFGGYIFSIVKAGLFFDVRKDQGWNIGVVCMLGTF